MPTPLPDIDHDLHDVLVTLVRERGPLGLRALTRQARLTAGRGGLDEGAVAALVGTATLLVPHPDGRVLDRELRHRAERYGMTLDQFVIALLGHLAWRTPFAEDLEPWDDWWPEDRNRRAAVAPLRLADGHPDDAG